MKTIEEDGVDIRAVDMEYLGSDRMLVLCSYTPNGGNSDFLLVELDEANNIHQQRRYGSAVDETPRKLMKNSDGRWVMVGETGAQDLFFIEVNTDWSIRSQFRYDGNSTERIRNASPCTGGFILTGNTGTALDLDMVIVKINNVGVTQWSQVIGGTKVDGNCHAQENPVTGKICFTGNFSSGSTDDDVVVGELKPDGTLCWLRVIRKNGVSVPEGGHDLMVSANGEHMYIVGISNGAQGLLLKVKLPSHTITHDCVKKPFLVGAREVNPGVPLSFQNITEIGGRIFIAGNQGAGAAMSLAIFEVNTGGAIQNQFLLSGNGAIASGNKCEFSLDGDNLYYCGRTNADEHDASGNFKGLVVREDLSADDEQSCLVETELTSPFRGYSLISLVLNTDYTTSHTSSPTNSTFKEQATTATQPLSDISIEEHCGSGSLNGQGFVKRLSVSLGTPPAQQDVDAIDIVRVSDDEYVMLSASENVAGAAGDFLLQWFDADGVVLESQEYGTEGNDIPVKLFYNSDDKSFIVTGSTDMNDPADQIKTDNNLFMVVIDGDPASSTHYDILNAVIYDFGDGIDNATSSSMCQNGDIIISGTTIKAGDGGDHIHLRLTSSGAKVWGTQIQHTGADGTAAAVEDPSTGSPSTPSDVWITGTFDGIATASGTNIILGKLDAGGGISLFNEYDKSSSSSVPSSNEVGNDLMLHNGKVYFGGSYDNFTNGLNGLLGIYDVATASVSSFYSYGGNSESESFNKFEKVDGRLLLAGTFTNAVSGSTSSDYSIVEIQDDGTVVGGRYFGANNVETWNKSRIVQHQAEEDFYFCGPTNSFSVDGFGAPISDGLLIRTDQDLAISCYFKCGDPDLLAINDLELPAGLDPVSLDGGSMYIPATYHLDDDYVLVDECDDESLPGGVGPESNYSSLESQVVSDWSVFPNPAQNLVNISFDSEINEMRTIELYDASGRVISSRSVSGNELLVSIVTSDLKNGLYLLRCQSGNSIVHENIQVIH